MRLEDRERKLAGQPESLPSQNQDEFEPVVIDFPIVELNKNIFDILDKRYYSVLCGSLIFHAMLVVFFLMNPLPEDEMMLRISEIQARLAKTLAEQEFETPLAKFEFVEVTPTPEEEAESPPAAPAKSTKAETKPDRIKPAAKIPKRPRRGRGGRSQAELASAVGSKGVLALLTSSSSVASGESVADILGGAGKNRADLDKALAGLSGIRSSASTGSGQGSAKIIGSRSENGGSIDDVVSGLGAANTGSFERGGDFAVTSDSPLIENGASGIAGRNQDDIQSVILEHNKTIQYCYEKELKRNPLIRGKVVVRFTITPQGKVKNVELVSSDLNNRRVEHCIISKIRRWSDFGSIDPTYGNTTIRQAYAFGY